MLRRKRKATVFGECWLLVSVESGAATWKALPKRTYMYFLHIDMQTPSVRALTDQAKRLPSISSIST